MILLLGDPSDLLLRDMADSAARRGHDCLLVTQTDLVEKLVVDDAITDSVTEISWTVAGRAFTSHDVCGVVNQLDDLDLTLLAGADADERLFGWRELRAYLLFALGILPNVLNPPAGQEMTAPAPPPACQWRAVGKMRPRLAVPRWMGIPANRAPAWSAGRRYRTSWCPPLGPVTWLPHDATVVDDAPGVAYEIPAGHRMDLTVLDRRVLALQCEYPLPEGSPEQLAELVAQLPIPPNMRLVTVTAFFCPEPRLLTYGSLVPGVRGDQLTNDQRATVAQAVLAAFDHPRRACRPARAAEPEMRQRVPMITPRWARHCPTDASVRQRKTSAGARPAASALVHIIAASSDPTAAHLYRRARRLGTSVAWWRAEELELLVDHLAEVVLSPDARCGFYFRRPVTTESRLEQIFTLVDEMLGHCRGPVVGAGLHRSTNHSKPLHSAALKRLGGGAVRIPDSIIRSAVHHCPDDDALVVKSISAAKTQVLALGSVIADADSRYTVPVLTQPRITGTNIRVHVVGEDVTAMTIGADVLDYRYGSFDVRLHRLPEAVARWVVAATRAEGLAFSGVDLIESDHATWCLEVNPNPGYHVFEQRLAAGPDRYRISDALLCYLGAGDNDG